MSCTTGTCPSTACVCCHVTNVAVDNTLVVGGSSTLTTNCPDGGALTVSSCVTQTSGDLAKVCGDPGQISLHVDTGRVIIDPNDALTDSTPGVHVLNSTAQTGGQLVEIAGATDQTALRVNTGQTRLDPNSIAGGALFVSNTATQSSGELVKITGKDDQVALHVDAGRTKLDPNSAKAHGLIVENTVSHLSHELVRIRANSAGGNALLVNNNGTQSSGNLVEIEGEPGYTALNVSAGNTVLGTMTLANGSITDTGGSISFGDENLSTTGTLTTGTLTAASGSTIGNLTLANGSITDSGGTIDLVDNDLTTTGTISAGDMSIGAGVGPEGSINFDSAGNISTNGTITTGTLTLASGSIQDTGGTIDFGNNDLETAGCVTADIIGTVTGTVSDISNHTTDALDEGYTNLYFKDARVRDADMGTFSGSIIDDNATVTEALQALVTEVETKLSAETITLATLKQEVALSANFADFKDRINALP